ncbi:uncharacterized protein LOC102705837 isoform X2 [Oryza brachyantha]|uniref:uncharacterized protein LOC102705837 isoform X2 n=1 Tax=Oryza brachyantha TaxID=4533 RepID=UPI0007765559|nr:uncharacterized protein LOC102705837 isoform X2 [Oryza brachyantha]
MASPSAPPSLLFRLRPMPCGGGGSLRVLSKRRLRQFLSPRTGRRRVVEELLMRLPEAGRRRGCGGFACFCSLDDRNDPPALPPDNKKILDEWPVLRRWDVPWEWPTISLTMVACAVSFLLTGMVEQAVLEYTGFQAGDATIDEKAEVLFFGQFIVTAVVLGVIFGITNTFRPFSDDVFRYDLKEPFKLENGWLLWAGVGLFGAIISISLAGAAMSFLGGETPERGHCLFAGHHRGSGTNSRRNCVSRISNGVLDYVVFYSNFCPYHCFSVCICSPYTWRISATICAWCCTWILICSKSQSSHSYCYTCYVELWSNIVANISSVAGIQYQGAVVGILKVSVI